MELYQLDYILHEPREDQGWLYMAEIPVNPLDRFRANMGWLYMAEIPELPGCRAWGDTADETLTELSTVAKQFILSYKDRGKTLPEGIALSLSERGK